MLAKSLGGPPMMSQCSPLTSSGRQAPPIVTLPINLLQTTRQERHLLRVMAPFSEHTTHFCGLALNTFPVFESCTANCGKGDLLRKRYAVGKSPASLSLNSYIRCLP